MPHRPGLGIGHDRGDFDEQAKLAGRNHMPGFVVHGALQAAAFSGVHGSDPERKDAAPETVGLPERFRGVRSALAPAPSVSATVYR